MSDELIPGDTIALRALDVTTRIPDQVAGLEQHQDGGVLLETMLGRYVLDQQGRDVWGLLDGNRSVDGVVRLLAERKGLLAADLDEPVRAFCSRLKGLGLVTSTSTSSTT